MLTDIPDVEDSLIDDDCESDTDADTVIVGVVDPLCDTLLVTLRDRVSVPVTDEL